MMQIYIRACSAAAAASAEGASAFFLPLLGGFGLYSTFIITPQKLQRGFFCRGRREERLLHRISTAKNTHGSRGSVQQTSRNTDFNKDENQTFIYHEWRRYPAFNYICCCYGDAGQTPGCSVLEKKRSIDFTICVGPFCPC